MVWRDVFLGVIAVATLAMAIAQIGVIIAAGLMARRVGRMVDQIEREVKPLFGHLNAIGSDASRAVALATAQVERADKLFADVAVRVEQTLNVVQASIGAPGARRARDDGRLPRRDAGAPRTAHRPRPPGPRRRRRPAVHLVRSPVQLADPAICHLVIQSLRRLPAGGRTALYNPRQPGRAAVKLLARVAYGALAALLALSARRARIRAGVQVRAARQAAGRRARRGQDWTASPPRIRTRADVFDAALYFPGMQLLVVSGKYSVPQLLTTRLANKEYRDVYLDLNGAATGKTFIEDPGADGLKPKRENNLPFDQAEMAGKRTMFDGDWKAQKLSEQDYMKAFSAADDRYTQILTALLAQLKKTS